MSGVAAASLWAWRSAIGSPLASLMVSPRCYVGVAEGVTLVSLKVSTVGVAVGVGVGVGVAPAAQKISIDASGVTP